MLQFTLESLNYSKDKNETNFNKFKWQDKDTD